MKTYTRFFAHVEYKLFSICHSENIPNETEE